MNLVRLIRTVALGIMVIAASVTMSAAQSTKKDKSSDLLTADQVKELVAHAKTPADHMKLSKHFAALATKYDAEAKEHQALAKAYRSNPTASESKRPGAPDTAVHCDRMGQLALEFAKEARDMAAEHERMATAAK